MVGSRPNAAITTDDDSTAIERSAWGPRIHRVFHVADGIACPIGIWKARRASAPGVSEWLGVSDVRPRQPVVNIIERPGEIVTQAAGPFCGEDGTPGARTCLPKERLLLDGGRVLPDPSPSPPPTDRPVRRGLTREPAVPS